MAAAGLGTNESDGVGRKKTEKDAIDSIDLLLKGGADINAADSKGQTALHGAAQKGWDQVVQFLADRGANLNSKGQKGAHAPRNGAGTCRWSGLRRQHRRPSRKHRCAA